VQNQSITENTFNQDVNNSAKSQQQLHDACMYSIINMSNVWAPLKSSTNNARDSNALVQFMGGTGLLTDNNCQHTCSNFLTLGIYISVQYFQQNSSSKYCWQTNITPTVYRANIHIKNNLEKECAVGKCHYPEFFYENWNTCEYNAFSLNNLSHNSTKILCYLLHIQMQKSKRKL